jgi:hypothetical protein
MRKVLCFRGMDQRLGNTRGRFAFALAASWVLALAAGCVGVQKAELPVGEGGATSSTGGDVPVGATTGTGGLPATGGLTMGGTATGGAAVGGSATGGAVTGGTATGGTITGGSATGGTSTGGVATGGAATGGALIPLGGGTGDGGTGGGTVPIGSNDAADCETTTLGCSTGWPFTCDADPVGGCTDEGGYYCCEPGCAPAASRGADCTNPAFPNAYLCHSSQLTKFDGCETVGSLVCCP